MVSKFLVKRIDEEDKFSLRPYAYNRGVLAPKTIGDSNKEIVLFPRAECLGRVLLADCVSPHSPLGQARVGGECSNMQPSTGVKTI